ncbi:MAG: HAD family hydrolase [Magnetococcales bacterium]|nr:HAD family hydrolase [Magnetococcales bacterium]MBF0157731.1 HAD family hydrolase [Magnetococcales bacterium]
MESLDTRPWSPRAGDRIGIDLDNTLADHDHLFVEVAREWGLLPSHSGPLAKSQLRPLIRHRPQGEERWIALQGEVYGRRMTSARLMPGAASFLDRCRRQGLAPWIISHKTHYAVLASEPLDLREAAMAWMAQQGFFADPGFAIPRERVLFADDRRQKLELIARVGCACFIDDLEELLIDPVFPTKVRRFLLHPAPTPLPVGPFQACRHWQEIEHALFHTSRPPSS